MVKSCLPAGLTEVLEFSSDRLSNDDNGKLTVNVVPVVSGARTTIYIGIKKSDPLRRDTTHASPLKEYSVYTNSTIPIVVLMLLVKICVLRENNKIDILFNRSRLSKKRNCSRETNSFFKE